MTPEETQRRIAALESRIQEIDKKLSTMQTTSVQQSSSSSSQVVLGALPSSLKAILNLGFAWVANQVSVKAGLGIVVDTTGVRAKIKSGGGLSVDTNGLYSAVNPSDYIPHSLATAANDFLVASGAGAFVKQALADVKTILGLGSAAYTEATAYPALVVKATTGHPGSPPEGMIEVNTFDNKVYIYGEATWRQLATW